MASTEPRYDFLLTSLTRCVLLTVGIFGYVYIDILQMVVDASWHYLHSTWFFNSVYFETVYTVLVYASLTYVPFLMHSIAALDRYKIGPDVHYVMQSTWSGLQETWSYAAPLLLLDTFLVKKYQGLGIDPSEWTSRRESWIQKTRALPTTPPIVNDVILELVGAFILFDFFFFTVHFVLHKNAWLYKNFHKIHHQHKHMNFKVTNKLSLLERTVTVLSANEALKLMSAHPLTRFIFIPLFVSAFYETHSGYDFPWSPNRVIPFNIMGGAARHYQHHVNGSKTYQPFFTYIDYFLELQRKKGKA